MADAPKLTKADTVALWEAVQWMAACLKESGSTVPAIQHERLATAKRALRKVNAIRKTQGNAGVGAAHQISGSKNSSTSPAGVDSVDGSRNA